MGQSYVIAQMPFNSRFFCISFVFVGNLFFYPVIFSCFCFL